MTSILTKSSAPPPTDPSPAAIVQRYEEFARLRSAASTARHRLEGALAAGAKVREAPDGTLEMVIPLDAELIDGLKYHARFRRGPRQIAPASYGPVRYNSDSFWDRLYDDIDLGDEEPIPREPPKRPEVSPAGLAAAIELHHVDGRYFGAEIVDEKLVVHGDAPAFDRDALSRLVGSDLKAAREWEHPERERSMELAGEGWADHVKVWAYVLGNISGEAKRRIAICCLEGKRRAAWLDALRQRQEVRDATALLELDPTNERKLTKWALSDAGLRAATLALAAVDDQPAPKPPKPTRKAVALAPPAPEAG